MKKSKLQSLENFDFACGYHRLDPQYITSVSKMFKWLIMYVNFIPLKNPLEYILPVIHSGKIIHVHLKAPTSPRKKHKPTINAKFS